jgi:hypothetical protein
MERVMSQEKDLRVVIGAWRGLEDGYVAQAKQSGRAYFLPPPGVWDTLKAGLGEEGAAQAAWLINQKALRPYIERGAPFEYTLRGVDNVKIEQKVVELIWQGRSEAEILELLRDVGVSQFSARWRALIELYSAGYQKTFDYFANSWILVKP